MSKLEFRNVILSLDRLYHEAWNFTAIFKQTCTLSHAKNCLLHWLWQYALYTYAAKETTLPLILQKFTFAMNLDFPSEPCSAILIREKSILNCYDHFSLKICIYNHWFSSLLSILHSYKSKWIMFAIDDRWFHQ